MTMATTTQTATDLLRAQHRQIQSMFDDLAAATGSGRTELFDCLRAFLATHETAEEIVVHPMGRSVGDEGERVVQARLAEEDEAKQALADLEKIGPGGADFDGRVALFRRAVESHADAEERELFPLLEAHCDHDQLVRMAARIQIAEKMAPTHPHPHGPNTSVGNLIVGPFAAMVDRVRDALTGHRGTR
jgi:hemerythrin superfamily protein